MTVFNMGVVQIDTQDDKKLNLEKIERLVGKAAERGADFVALPEYASYIGDEAGESENAEPIPGPTSQFYSRLAREKGIWLHCGSFFESVPGEEKLYNTTLVMNPRGEVAAKYRKIHLYDIEVPDGVSFRESRTKRPGEEIVSFESDFCTMGLSICFDVRFPELYRILALRGAKVVFVPAEFALFTGRDHWETLLRARAIENQCYIVAPGQIGVKPAYQCYARSLVVDPWGTVTAKAGDSEGVFVTEIDIGYLERVRTQLPSLANRRPASYVW